jgi:hypothetical protein
VRLLEIMHMKANMLDDVGDVGRVNVRVPAMLLN